MPSRCRTFRSGAHHHNGSLTWLFPHSTVLFPNMVDYEAACVSPRELRLARRIAALA